MATLVIETLQERVALGTTGRIDREAGVIRGVKVLGSVSLNGRRYAPEALRNAVGLYEGVKVAIDHPSGNGHDRSVRDVFGVLRNARLTGSEIRADLHYNPAHPMAEQVAWFAENNPSAIGLSHNAEGRTAQRDGHIVVEEITRVRSVDLVADPATTNGLFESRRFSQPASSEDFARRISEGDGADAPPASDEGGQGGDELRDLADKVRGVADYATSARDLTDQLLNLLDGWWAERQTVAEPNAATDDVTVPADASDFAEMVTGGTRRPATDPRDDHDRFLETIRA